MMPIDPVSSIGKRGKESKGFGAKPTKALHHNESYHPGNVHGNSLRWGRQFLLAIPSF
jgi:hypothetical protein